ncbi:MAG: hypothetical protein ACI4EW_09720 [Butyrivibrio sp.]
MKKIKKILAKVVACTMIFAVAFAGISLIKGKEAKAAVTKTTITSVKWEFDVSGLTTETQIVWNDGSQNVPIDVDGDGAYSVTVNYSLAEGIQNMGYFPQVADSPVEATVTKVTVNGTYVFTTYNKVLKLASDWENGTANIWGFIYGDNVDTDIMTSASAKFMYNATTELIEFYADPDAVEETPNEDDETGDGETGDGDVAEIALYIGGVEADYVEVNGDGVYTIAFQGAALSAGQWGTMYIKQKGDAPTFEGKGVKFLQIQLNGEDYEIPSLWTQISSKGVTDTLIVDASFYNQWAADKDTMNIGDKTGLDLADLQVTQAMIQFEIGDAEDAEEETTPADTTEETTTANDNPGAGSSSSHTTAYALIIVGAVAACAAVVLAGRKKVEER